jgi:hypothetical protein
LQLPCGPQATESDNGESQNTEKELRNHDELLPDADPAKRLFAFLNILSLLPIGAAALASWRDYEYCRHQADTQLLMTLNALRANTAKVCRIIGIYNTGQDTN